jgi:hypothetical protein
MKFRCTLFLSLSLFSCLSLVEAQNKEVFRFEFSVYGLRPGDYSNIYFEDARGKPTPVEFQRKRKSDRYQAEILPEKPILRFLRREDKNEAIYEEISVVALDQLPDEPLLIFAPIKQTNSNGEFKIISVENNASSAEAGTLRVLNLTGVTLIGAIDRKRFELPAFTSSPAFDCVQNGSADVSIVAEGSSRYHLVYRNNLSVDRESRAILFLTPPFRKVSLKLGGQMLYEDVVSESN